MQAKHIDTDKLLALLFVMAHQPKTGVMGPHPTPHWVMVHELWEWWNDNVVLTPYKVLSAKLARMDRAGLITGYGGHDYRGDLEVTHTGFARLARQVRAT